MLETVKTVAVIISASVAFCAFVVGCVHYIGIFVTKSKDKRLKREMSKNEALKVAKLKDKLYQDYLETKAKEVK